MQAYQDLSPEDQVYHESWMQLAIQEAKKGQALGEVPIGALLVQGDQVLARGHNLREVNQEATAHAEMQVIRAANQSLGRWRLSGTTLYVTLEPCAMCAGALIQARVDQVVYGASDPKGGCCGSLMNLLSDERFNHQPQVLAGVCSQECGDLLRDFFRSLRQRNKARRQAANEHSPYTQAVDKSVDK